MTLLTRDEYLAALDAWAARTSSEPLESWRGPGDYEPSGHMSDEWRPVATLEYRAATPTTNPQPNH